MERRVVVERARMPAAARESDLPLSRFPLRGKAGAGGFPPSRWHAARQQKALARIGAAAPPARGVQSAPLNPPLAHPPEWTPLGPRPNGQPRSAAGQKFQDGRHVVLDFNDLLIEARDTGAIRWAHVRDSDKPATFGKRQSICRFYPARRRGSRPLPKLFRWERCVPPHVQRHSSTGWRVFP
jgi:hypothetical protein